MGLPDNAMERFDLFEEIGQGTYGLVHRYNKFTVVLAVSA